MGASSIDQNRNGVVVDRVLQTKSLADGMVGQRIKTDLWMWPFLVGFILGDEQEETSLVAVIGAKLLIAVVA